MHKDKNSLSLFSHNKGTLFSCSVCWDPETYHVKGSFKACRTCLKASLLVFSWLKAQYSAVKATPWELENKIYGQPYLKHPKVTYVAAYVVLVWKESKIAICTAMNKINFPLKVCWEYNSTFENIIPLLILIFSNPKDIHLPFLDYDSLRPKLSKEVYFGAVQCIWSKTF